MGPVVRHVYSYAASGSVAAETIVSAPTKFGWTIKTNEYIQHVFGTELKSVFYDC